MRNPAVSGPRSGDSHTDWNEIRRDFPVLRQYRYFYTASGGPLPRPVFARIVEYQRQVLEHGDAFWDQNLQRVEKARGRIARYINAEPEEISFIPGLGFGMNLLADLFADRGDVIVPGLDFPSTILPWLHRRAGSVRRLEADAGGEVAAERFAEAMDDRTGIICTSHVQFSNGFRQDLHEVGRLKKDHLFFVNATQSAGAFQIDVKKWNIDALCTNSYKWLLGGYGCGFLYLSRRLLDETGVRDVGWFSAEARDELRNDVIRPVKTAARFSISSPPFASIFSLDAALEYLMAIGIDRIEARVLELNRDLTDRLSVLGIPMLSPTDPAKYRSGQTLVGLDRPGETVSKLRERGILCTEKPEGMRVATHFFVNRADIDDLVETLSEILA